MEVLLKWYYGFVSFWKSGWNIFDVVIIVAALSGPCMFCFILFWISTDLVVLITTNISIIVFIEFAYSSYFACFESVSEFTKYFGVDGFADGC